MAARISRRPTPAIAWQRACALPQKPVSPQYLQVAKWELLESKMYLRPGDVP
jgi:hypothetical protein